MTDDRVDALLRRLDVADHPDSAFADQTLRSLEPHVRVARRRDAGRLGSLRRSFDGLRRPRRAFVPAGLRTVAYLAVLAMLLLAAFVVTVVGALNRPTLMGNGPIVMSDNGTVQLLDASTGRAHPLVSVEGNVNGLSRSPDGRWVSFWEPVADGHRLAVVAVDGSVRRDIEIGFPVTWNGCTDAWASDSRRTLSEVLVDGRARILVSDIETRTVALATPSDVDAHCGLWSPNGDTLAFSFQKEAQLAGLAVMALDGSPLRPINGLEGFDVSGANSWSKDGRWVYFDAAAGGVDQVFRADVTNGTAEQLTDGILGAAAPALSPDDRLVTFLVPHTAKWLDATIHVAQADGTAARPVLDHAIGYGWSADSQFIIAEWKPPGGVAGGLVTIRPDGTDQRVILELGSACSGAVTTPCLDGFSWGQARP